MMDKYKLELLQNCSRLDAVTNGNGKITDCAKAITDNHKEASKVLCKLIEKAAQLKDPQITSIAIATKDSLIKFYGHREACEKLSNLNMQWGCIFKLDSFSQASRLYCFFIILLFILWRRYLITL